MNAPFRGAFLFTDMLMPEASRAGNILSKTQASPAEPVQVVMASFRK